MRKHTNCLRAFVVLIFIGIGIIGLAASTGHAQEDTVRYRLPQGSYIELPRELLELMGDQISENLFAYTNEMSGAYLNQLVTSNEMVLQSNTEIIRQQERIIQLLEALLAKPSSNVQEEANP